MALSEREQKYRDFAANALPSWFTDQARAEEYLGALAKIFDAMHSVIAFWIDQTRILLAQGPTGTEPDWLNQHALDRGTSRQSGETDEGLRKRIRNVPDALTRPLILDAAQEIIEAEGVAGTVEMVELRRDKAYVGNFVSDSGVGGTFTKPGGSTARFQPLVPFAAPPFNEIDPGFGHDLAISGAASAGNNGTFPVEALFDDSAEYVNASAVAEIDLAVTWAVQKKDQDDNLADGFARAYVGRGYRVGTGRPNTIILILPFGSSAGTVASVEEMLRQKKGAGIRAIVERRLVP